METEKKPVSGDVRKPVKKRLNRVSAKAEGASQASSSSAGSSLANSRVSTPNITVNNTNISSATVTTAISASSTARDVNNQLKFQYSRQELLDLRACSLSKIKPKELDTDLEVEDGHWDPESWISNFATNSVDCSSPLVRPREKRKTGTEADGVARKRPMGNLSKQLSDNGNFEDEDEHIILGPQRGSFGTGCQVKPSAITNDRTEKRDISRKDTSRIGSGRIQISDRQADREPRLVKDRDEAKGGYERRRIDRDQEDSRMRFSRLSDSSFSGRYDREDAYRTSNNFDRESNKRTFERERDREVIRDQHFERRKEVNLKGKADYPERREYDDRRGSNKTSNRYSSRDSYSDQMSSGYSRNQEPEWFTDGPKHQSDTIELGGFESSFRKERSDNRKSPSFENGERFRDSGRRGSRDSGSTDGGKRSGMNRKSGELDSTEKTTKSKESVKAPEDEPLANNDVGVQHKIKTNESSNTPDSQKNNTCESRNEPEVSDEVSHGTEERHGQTSNEFDFNMFLNDNVGSQLGWLQQPASVSSNGGSRFQQWFRPETSDGHLSPRNDTANGTLSAAPMFSLFGRGPSPSSQSASNNSFCILDMLHKPEQENPALPSIYHRLSSHNSPTQTPVSIDVAANVKALMESVQATAGQPVLPAGGKILMAEDLEASLLSTPNDKSSMCNEPLSQGQHFPSHGMPPLSSPRFSNHGPSHGNKPPGPAPALPAGARITTLEELEAGLRDIHIVPSGKEQVPERNSQTDTSAFQKLLGLFNMDEVSADTISSSTAASISTQNRPADVVQPKPIPGQFSDVPPANWMQGNPDANACFEFNGLPTPVAVQHLVQQPRQQQPQQQSIPLQNLFSQPPPPQLHQVPHHLMGFMRPPVNAPLQVNTGMQQPSMSPQVLQHCSPHASSPIMFGTQPPHNITAPMPIHSGQRPLPCGPQNVSQFAHGGGVNNQQLPQEAVDRAYLQFLQMQMMTSADRMAALHAPANHGAQPSTKTKSSLSSIPTAVIRKMKADEKLPKDGDFNAVNAMHPASCRSSTNMLNDGSTMQSTGLSGSADVLLKGKSLSMAAPISPAVPGFDAMLTDSGLSHLGPAMSDAASRESRNGGRRLVGQGVMYQPPAPAGVEIMHQQPIRPQTSMLLQSMAAPSGRPIVKAVGQPMPYNYAGGAPPRANGTLTAEQLQVLQIRNTSNPRLMIQQQQQQRASGLQQPINTLDGFAGRLPSQLDQQQLNSILLQQLQNVPSSTGSNFVGATVQSRPPMKPARSGDAIARWFGADVYGDRRLPNMPGQRVMTLDEIECVSTPPTN